MSNKILKKPLKLIAAICENDIADLEDNVNILTREAIQTYTFAFRPLQLDRSHKGNFARWSKDINRKNSLKNYLIQLAALKIELFGDEEISRAILKIHNYKDDWIRSIDTWKKKTYNNKRQVISLIRHLFCKYPDVPIFMDDVWFQGPRSRGRSPDTGTSEYIEWYIFLGQGGNIRKAKNFPIPNYTKKMAFNFLNAPDNYNVKEAIYWGYIHGIGGNERLVQTIAGTFIGESFNHFDFWSTVIQWLVNNPMLDHMKIQPIFDYIRYLKYDIQRVGYREQGNLEPDFSMKGRTPDALLRSVDEWHRLTQVITRRSVRPAIIKWEPFDIKDFQLLSGNKDNRKIWRITQLITAKELISEGRALNHCVGSYSGSCAAGRSAIFSMSLQDNTGITNKLTIEVSKTFNIGQIQGKNNKRKPTSHENNLISDWANGENLKVSKWIR